MENEDTASRSSSFKFVQCNMYAFLVIYMFVRILVQPVLSCLLGFVIARDEDKMSLKLDAIKSAAVLRSSPRFCSIF